MPEVNETFSSPDAWVNSQAWIERPLEFWSECRERFGETFELNLGSIGKTVLFCNPASVQQVFALPADSYQCGPYNAHYQEIMGQQSILAMDGPAHREQRRLLLPILQPDVHPACFAPLNEILATHLDSCNDADVVDLRPTIHEMAFKIMLHVLLESRSPELANLLRNIFLKDLIKDYGSWSPWARFTKWHPLLRKTIAAECKRLRTALAEGDPGCCDSDPAFQLNSDSRIRDDQPSPLPRQAGLLETLASYRDTTGEYLDDVQIADHVFTMLIAGVDTSAIATLWALFRIARDPVVHDRLQQEIDQIPEKSHEQFTVASGELPFLAATSRESLRMIPVVTTPTGRKLLKPVTIDGKTYPPGVTLIPLTYLVHRNPELYPNPDEFNPDRFLQRTFKPYEYFPFGGGHRTCPGAKLAFASMQSILHLMLSRYQFELACQEDIRPIRHGTLLAPSLNLRFRVRGRNTANSTSRLA